jgi:hypothetical protein
MAKSTARELKGLTIASVKEEHGVAEVDGEWVSSELPRGLTITFTNGKRLGVSVEPDTGEGATLEYSFWPDDPVER